MNNQKELNEIKIEMTRALGILELCEMRIRELQKRDLYIPPQKDIETTIQQAAI